MTRHPLTRLLVVALVGVALATPAASGKDDETTRRLLGVLLYTRVSVAFDDTPVREAFASLRDSLGIPIIGRFADDPLGYGIDPETRLTFVVENEPALTVLELMLAECSSAIETCTWQIRNGFVEVGTRGRLSVPAARERRFYDITDLMFEPASVGSPRPLPEVAALNLVQDVVETIEPGTWDWGQVWTGSDSAAPDLVEPQKRSPAESVPVPGVPEPEASNPTRRYVTPIKTSIIRYWRDVLIVDAPDFVHRQIDGYPPPIRPAGIADRPIEIGTLREPEGEDRPARWMAPSTQRFGPEPLRTGSDPTGTRSPDPAASSPRPR